MSKNNLPKNHQPQNRLIAQQQSFSYSSPYPPPQVLEAMEKMAPGSAKEVIAMSMKSVETHLRIEEMSRRDASKFEFRRLHLAFALAGMALLGGFVLASIRGDAGAYAILVGEIAALAGAFLYAKAKK